MLKMEINKFSVGLAVGVGLAASSVIGYCIYFDRKRRTDPDYKKKVRERRRRQRKTATTSGSRTKMPDFSDYDSVQKFFLQEVQMGEALIGRGEIDEGVEHLANAIVVCGQPTQLLQVLQQTLPPQVFEALIHKMKDFNKSASGAESSMRTGSISEDINDELE